MIPIKPVGPDVTARSPATAALQYLQPGALNLKALPPLSLYIHWPWCVRKCPYCDFNSHEAKGPVPEAAYLDALRADLEQSLPLIWGRKIHTVFIGGGTPSLMSAAGLERLMSDVRTLLPLDLDAEITMEANPGTFEADKFKSFRASGHQPPVDRHPRVSTAPTCRRWAASTMPTKQGKPSRSRSPTSTISTWT